MQNFDCFGLHPALIRALTELGYTTPTPIQTQAIPIALEGRDVMGTAQTGTGKTGAFGVPLVSRLMSDPKRAALVMTPTRELASQVMSVLAKLARADRTIHTALLIGGEPMGRQLQQLQMRPRLIVGTPGRINDHLNRRSLNLSEASFLVLDETDRMLDMGFGPQIDRVLSHMPEQRQTLLFSATLPANILKLSQKYLTNPSRVAAGPTNAPAGRIKQETVQLHGAQKYDQLIAELDRRSGSVIVFAKTKWGAQKMAQKLCSLGYAADAIHGALRQNQRDKAIRAFRERESRIMVATDIAARGLDIPHIEHVINYDLPQCPEDFIHRIGRTARAGAEGEAVTFVTPEDSKKWLAIRRLLDPSDAPKRSARTGRNGSSAGRSSGGEATTERGDAGASRRPERNATRDVARNATRGTERNATRGMERSGTRDVARDATRGAERDATRGAERNATRGAERNATRDVARDATRDTDRSGAKGKTGAAKRAGQDGGGSNARHASRPKKTGAAGKAYGKAAGKAPGKPSAHRGKIRAAA